MFITSALQQINTAKLPALFQKCLKTVYALKVNETKVTSTNDFIVTLLA